MQKVIIFPTDTVYGIGCSVFDRESIKRIYDIKHRPLNKPLAVLCNSLSQIEQIAYVDEVSKILINKYLPGALTIVLKSKDNIKQSMGIDTIGVRIPNSKIALDILEKMGPMATTSVNESGNVPLNEYDEIYKEYNSLVDKIYDTNESSSNVSSTVIKVENNNIILLREGQIAFQDILKTINNI